MKAIRKRHTRRAFGKNIGFAAVGMLVLGQGGLLAAPATPKQTEGPFYPDSDLGDTDMDLTLIQGHTETAKGQHIYVHGKVTDTSGNPLANATVDVWQANDSGRYRHDKDPNPAPLDHNFQGWGIVQTDSRGFYRYKTIIPGAYSLEWLGGKGWRARHIHYKLSHDGHAPLSTQMYFPGDPLIEQDLEYAQAPESERQRLISVLEEAHQSGLPIYRFDLVMAAA